MDSECLSRYWFVACEVQPQHYLLWYLLYYFQCVLTTGEESKVPNMQDVVRKLLNALHHAIMSHVVRYF